MTTAGMTKKDLITGLVLTVLGVAVFVESWRMPGADDLAGVDTYNAPGIVPAILGIVIAIFGVLLLIRSLRARLKKSGEEPEAIDEVKEPFFNEGNRNLVLALVLTLAYAGGLVGLVPFGLATFLFVFVFISLFDWDAKATRGRKVLLLSTAFVQAIIVAVAVTLVFENIFRVSLP